MASPRLIGRYAHHVEMILPHNKGIRSYSVGSANALDTAFTGSTAMFQVPTGGTYRSPTIQRKGLGRTQNNNRGLTHMLYDPEDFWVGGGAIPHDSDISYVRVAEVDFAGVVQPEGPIFIVPPPGFLSNPRPSLSLAGTAPLLVALATGLPPVGSLHIVLPTFSDNIRIRNLDAGNPLFVAFGDGQPCVQLPFGQLETFYDAAVKDLFLFSTGGAVLFDARFALVNGEMG